MTVITIEEIWDNDTLTLSVDGNIDVHSSDEFTNAVICSFQKTNSLVIDMEKVPYVSSAGLRAFVLGKKTADSKGASFSLVNVSEEVKTIFHTTGFDKILKYD